MFSIGSSRSHSSSQSYGYSGSSSDAFSRGVSESEQSIAFEDIFSSLYGNAAGAAGRVASMAPQLNTQAAQLFGAGTGFLEDLSGSDELDARLAETGNADELIALLGDDLGRFASEELLPQVTSRGVATGTLGGGRGEVAKGRIGEAMLREFASGSAAIRSADVTRRDQLAIAASQRKLNAAGVGLNALPGMFDVAQAGMLAELAPWMSLAQITGGPTVLGRSSSEDIATEIARAFSEDFSSSSSKSKSFSLGIGG